MGDVVYRSEVHITRERGPIREARLPGREDPITFGVHGAVADHYGVDMDRIEGHTTTLDYVVAAAGG